MSSFRLHEPSSTMDWKDITSTSSFSPLTTPSKNFFAMKGKPTGANTATTAAKSWKNPNLSMTPLDNSHIQQPGRYVSVIEKLQELARQGGMEIATARRPQAAIYIAPLPKDISRFLEKTRHEFTESLLESERGFAKSVQESSQQTALREESEKFRGHVTRDLLTVATSGMADMLRKHRDRREELKTFSRLDPTRVVGDRTMTDEEESFCRTLREVNEAIICKRPVNPAENFSNLVGVSGNHHASQLWRAFTALTSPFEHPKSTPNSPEKFRLSRLFAESLVNRSRQYLENSAYESHLSHASSSSSSNMAAADLVRFCAKSHLTKLKLAQPSLTSGGEQPVWALIYYSLRLGLSKVSLDFVETGDDSTQDIRRYLVEYDRQRGWLSDGSRSELEKAYRRLGGANLDVFKKAVYAVLSKTETNETFPGVTSTVSDWLWMKLSQVSLAGKGFTLIKLQEQVKEKFDSNASDDAECFLVYILTGLFELALERLAENTKYLIHAVHMAVCLQHSDILITSNDSQEGGDSPIGLDFIALIKSHVRPFRKQTPEAAVEYYFHLAPFPALCAIDVRSDHPFRSMFELCLYKLARDTRSAWKIFGVLEDAGEDAGEDVRLRRGVVHKFLTDPEGLMVAVAKAFETEGRFEEALVLLELAGQQRMLLQALLRILSAILVVPVEDAKRKSVYAVATASAKRLKKSIEEEKLIGNVFILLDLITFIDTFDRKQYHQAVVIMKELRIVPVDADKVLEAVDNYKSILLTDVRRCVPEMTLYTMRALVSWFAVEREKTHGYRVLSRSALEYLSSSQLMDSTISHGNELQIDQLRETFRQYCLAVLEFAQSIPSPQLPDLLETLVKLESTISGP
ncbi:putative Nuclear pore complex protein Nup93 [Hypsibius exemplaris]|uniref:Nuclear pore protein n=1 Tax=Hypsibius exemplaris TaxID=2072580 RepID=A0A1W0WQ00_HYPEX|nr:putative Nuclear pore complex protein Nup93 [Hypsibius exemplaris]